MKTSDQIRQLPQEHKGEWICTALLIALAGEISSILHHKKMPDSRIERLLSAVHAYETSDLDRALFYYDVANNDIPSPPEEAAA